MNGTITTNDRTTTKVHTYTAPARGFFTTTHIIELPAQLFVVDAQYALPYAREALAYAESLAKPITRLYISHEHPDHYFGAEVFGAPVYALAEVKAAIEARGDDQAKHAHSQQGDIVPAQATRPDHVVEPGDETIDGTVFRFDKVEGGESASLLTIGLPDDGVVIVQDLVFNNVHLFIAERRFDTWQAAVERYQQLPYDTVLPGHGKPGGTELYDQVLEYLRAAGPALDQAGDGHELKSVLTERFPGYDGVELIDLQIQRFLFPPDAPS